MVSLKKFMVRSITFKNGVIFWKRILRKFYVLVKIRRNKRMFKRRKWTWNSVFEKKRPSFVGVARIIRAAFLPSSRCAHLGFLQPPVSRPHAHNRLISISSPALITRTLSARHIPPRPRFPFPISKISEKTPSIREGRRVGVDDLNRVQLQIAVGGVATRPSQL